MTPWRLARGEKLYRDIHFPHGPLGPYVAAASEGIVGRSLPARIGLGAVIALLHLAALERLSRRVLTPWRAALAASAAVAAAMFLRPGGWLFPFSLDTAIAVTALTWACVLQDRAESEGRGGAAGLCLVAALLARPEMGIAAVAVFAFASRRQPLRLLRLAVFPWRPGPPRTRRFPSASGGNASSPTAGCDSSILPRPTGTSTGRMPASTGSVSAWRSCFWPPSSWLSVRRSSRLRHSSPRGSARAPGPPPRFWRFWRSGLWRRRPSRGFFLRSRSPGRSSSFRRWCA